VVYYAGFCLFKKKQKKIKKMFVIKHYWIQAGIISNILYISVGTSQSVSEAPSWAQIKADSKDWNKE